MKIDRRSFLQSISGLAAFLTSHLYKLRTLGQADTVTPSPGTRGQTYFVDAAGSDRNSGSSALEPWRTFSRINSRTFGPGDSILLRRGCVWHEELKINGTGEPGGFLTLSAYGEGNRPKIQLDRRPADWCIRLQNASYLRVSSIEVCDGGAGIVLFYDHSYNNRSVYLDDIVAHDFMGLPGAGKNGRVTWSYGIGVTGVEDTPNDQTRVLTDLRITNTEVYNTGAGIALDWANHFCVDGTLALHNKFGEVFMEHLNLHDNTVDPIAFASLYLTSVTGCTIQNSNIRRGAKFAPTGTSALQVNYTRNVVLKNIAISDTLFNACPDNSALDLECDNENVIIENCTFTNNAGPAIEILATPNNPDPYSRNITIRNNTFVGNNWARKLGPYQIVVPDWQHGNTPSGIICNNRYQNAPKTRFFGGDGNITRLDVSQNTNIGPAEVEAVLRSWNFGRGRDLEKWEARADIKDLSIKSGALQGAIFGPDPGIVSPDGLGLPIGAETSIRITLRNGTVGAFGQVYFLTDADGTWNETKHRDFWLYASGTGYHTYDLDMSNVPSWSGVLRRLRVDPEQNATEGNFSIRQIEIVQSRSTK